MTTFTKMTLKSRISISRRSARAFWNHKIKRYNISEIMFFDFWPPSPPIHVINRIVFICLSWFIAALKSEFTFTSKFWIKDSFQIFVYVKMCSFFGFIKIWMRRSVWRCVARWRARRRGATLPKLTNVLPTIIAKTNNSLHMHIFHGRWRRHIILWNLIGLSFVIAFWLAH